jgi:uncharacterized protein (TIGR02996 family)
MTDDHDRFLAKILENLDDDLPKLIYADWLDERGESDLAHAYRWCACYKKRPCVSSNALGWWQWRFSDHAPALKQMDVLPINLSPPMCQGRWEHTRHDSFVDAMLALANCFASLRATVELRQ